MTAAGKCKVSPIGYCHVLLIPQVQECLPQRVDQESFLLAMYVAKEARNPFFRVGYNSLGAFATINHLHFQAYYLKVQYPVKKAPTEELTVVGNGVSISQLVQYPNWTIGLIFLSPSKCSIDQCYAEKQTFGKASHEFLNMTINPAVWELSGHLVLKRRKDYDEASEATLCRLLVEASLSGAEFQELKRCVLESLASASPE
ncbi:GDP-L-galactose phosphorylase 1-like [Hordeum vulgare]|nr:GDP-L-galactose phosphorylase 1-like [Hordeum vulgare]